MHEGLKRYWFDYSNECMKADIEKDPYIYEYYLRKPLRVNNGHVIISSYSSAIKHSYYWNYHETLNDFFYVFIPLFLPNTGLTLTDDKMN